MPAGRALIVVVIALLLGGLLNVRSLTEAAERQPFGLKRDTALVLAWPFQQISGLLGLDQPRELLTERLGRDTDAGAAGDDGAGETTVGGDTGGDVELTADGLPVDALASDTLAAAAALAGRQAEGAELDGATAIPGEGDDVSDLGAAGQLPERLAGGFTAAEPLQIAVIGDSLTEQLGPAIIDRTERPGVPATTLHDFTYSSGLTRPDFYDWPNRAAQIAEQSDIDLWIVMIGANDAQDVRDDQGRFRHIGSDEWEAIYSERIGRLMDLLIRDGRAVIWVGQPIMRSGTFDESMEYVSELYRRQAAARSLVSYVDSRAVFADGNDRYADYLPGDSGQLALMRMGDGIHLTRAGAGRLAEQIFPLLPVITDPDAPAVPVG